MPTRRLCRRWLVVTLAILVAIQAVLTTEAWVYPYAKLLIPDVMRTETGLATPPLVTVKNDYIVGFRAPPSPSADEGK